MAALVMAAAVLVAGCGDDSASDAGGSPTSAPTGGTDEGAPPDSTPTPTGSEDMGPDDGGGESGPGSDLTPGTGFIQIGDLRHELTVEPCANLFGAINGRAVSVSGPGDVKVVFNISPEDWQENGATFDEPGSIQFSDADGSSWTTGVERYINDYELPDDIDPSTIAISSYHIADDGESVSGEATFYDLYSLVYATPVAPKSGSFAFACPPS